MGPAWRTSRSLISKAFWGVPIVITFRDCVYCPVTVEDRCMQPVLNPRPEASRDRVIVERWSVLLYRYERGNVFLMRSPDNPKKLLVKRLLALEGDWITIPGEADIRKIPQGFCWVEGDNVDCSEDSRTKFGPVPVSLIEGRVAHVFWPPSRVGAVKRSMPAGRLLLRNANALRKPSQHFSSEDYEP